MFSDEALFRHCLLSLFLITPPTVVSLLLLSAPYGRHRRPGWGPTLPPPLAWFLMESPTVWLTLLLFPHGRNRRDARALALISPFLLHYVHRTLWVSCPNYLGEIVEWLGWAVMTWSWAGLGFFVYTCANLVPRAEQNHRWYLEKFGEDYPSNRKAVIPFVY
ncbi:Steroid 5-alpha-reductase DET2 [Striga hermonthica]|uniref:Steroid 5-alpha-reductase DET2 n=1 Tax=Striga hermonthica TaxID=68872 RepID=A0A9N7NT61_STRHE|nr:Steroid 5-alpha-reductase DET2 [Striga hermonthica]